VTTVYGDVVERARIARKLLRLSGHGDVPVVAGRGPTLGGRDPGRMISSGAGYASDEAASARDGHEDAAEFIIEKVMGAAAGDAPVLVAIGPLTNVGEAIRREPRLAGRLRGLVVMGGRLGVDAQQGEHNVNCDPDATRVVLESGADLAIGTYEVTVRATLDRTDVARLRRAEEPACLGAADMLELYLGLRQRDWTAMYDPITLTLAYSDAYVTTRKVHIQGTYGDRLSRFDVLDGPPNSRVSVDIDAAAFHEHLLGTIVGG